MGSLEISARNAEAGIRVSSKIVNNRTLTGFRKGAEQEQQALFYVP